MEKKKENQAKLEGEQEGKRSSKNLLKSAVEKKVTGSLFALSISQPICANNFHVLHGSKAPGAAAGKVGKLWAEIRGKGYPRFWLTRDRGPQQWDRRVFIMEEIGNGVCWPMLVLHNGILEMDGHCSVLNLHSVPG